MAKLTKREKIFCEEYVGNFGNGYKAAIAAGYSQRSAYSIASENLTKPKIQAYIKELTEIADSERLMKVEEALSLSASIARGEPQPYVYKEIDQETGEIKVEEKKYISAGIKERNQALEHLYKANQVFVEKQEIDVKSVTFVDDIPVTDDD